MRRWLPLIATCLGSFMLLIDVTIVNVALPDMARDLHSSFTSLQWVIDAYALVLAALLLGLGSVADRLGHRRVYLTGLVVFALASMVCGLSVDPLMLDVARGVQGVGGAAMFATTFALINGSYNGRDRGVAYGIWGAVSGAAAAIGPVLGGVLTQAISWRWIFFVNLPLSIATIALTIAVIPVIRGRGGSRLDLLGTAGFTVAAAALTLAFTEASNGGWSSPTVLVSLALTVVAAVAFVVRELRTASPMIDLRLFRRPLFAAVVTGALVMSFSAFAALTYATIWTQSVLGLSPIESGLVVIPLPVLSATLSATSGTFAYRLARALSIGGGVVLVGVGGLLTALLVGIDASWTMLLPGLAVTGAGAGLSVPTMSSTASAAVGDERSGIASGAVNTARQLGQALGIALLGSLVAEAASSSLSSHGVAHASTAATQLVGGGGTQQLLGSVSGVHRAALAVALHDAFASGLVLAYVVAGIAAVAVGLLVAWWIHTGERAQARSSSAAAPARRSSGRVGSASSS